MEDVPRHLFYMKPIICYLIFNLVISNCLAQVTFELPENPEKVHAGMASDPINIDGKLDEGS